MTIYLVKAELGFDKNRIRYGFLYKYILKLIISYPNNSYSRIQSPQKTLGRGTL